MSGTAAPQGSQALDGQGTSTVSKLDIGSRKSKLALVQANLVVEALNAAFPKTTCTVKARDTAAGDIDKITPFKDMMVKNIWTHELETLMVEGKLDLLVHSLKDVPTLLPPDCEIGGVLIRADPRDALVLKAGAKPCGIADLPAGSVIGTSSIRRTAQIALRYPHLQVKDLRGNLPTRLSKLDAEDSPFDAIILAAAGLIRIDLGHRIAQLLDSKNGNMLYAVGQGAIGIENKSSDLSVRSMVQSITHQKTFLAITAERSLLRTLEGGCSAPLGVETEWLDDTGDASTLRLQSIVVSVDGKESVEVDLSQQVTSVAEAEAYGVSAADELVRKGAGKILAEIKAKKPTTPADLRET